MTGSRRLSFPGRRGAGSAPVSLDEPAAEPAVEVATTGKGRPTPKRSEAQRRRGGPVAPPPTTRREAAKRLRDQQAEDRRAGRTGTGSAAPPRVLRRDAGPVRALVRDTVDARRNIAVLLLPVALVVFVADLSRNLAVMSLTFRLWVALLLAVVVDTVLTGVAVRRAVAAAFPEEASLRGHVGYGLLRTTVIRRFRQPPPRVAPRGFRRG